MNKQQHSDPNYLGLILGLLLVLTLPFSAMGGEKSQLQKAIMLEQVVLRQNVMVDDHLIILGDIFKGTGDKSTIAIAYAPEPGKKAFFDANWLYRIANGHGLKWRPLSMKQNVQVKRKTVTIERDEIEDYIFAALIDKGADPKMTIELSNRSVQLHVPSSSEAIIEVTNTNYDQRTQRFSAHISTPGSKSIRVTGRLQKMLNIPVLNRRILRNEMIMTKDIKWVKSPSKRVQNDIILHVDDLIGKTPKRGLRAGALIRSSEVQRPVLVEKGSIVTMILKTPLMVLTSQGRAVDPGANGDVIRITNTQSNKVVQAVVTAAGLASITPASQMAVN
jgi:flagellar basal body P-ring formation protein FlgA